jgi:hypothetical protein
MSKILAKNNLKDLIDELDSSRIEFEERERKLILDVELLTVEEAIGIAKFYHDNGHEPTEIHSIILEKLYTQSNCQDFVEYGKDLIDRWSNKLFIAKLKGQKISDWRSKLGSLLSNKSNPVDYQTMNLIVSFPRYDSYEERYIQLGNDYITTAKKGRISVPITLKLVYIDSWEEKNSSDGRRRVYAFETYNEGRLVLWSVRSSTMNNSVILFDELLRIANTFLFKGRAWYKIVDDGKYALQFDQTLVSMKIAEYQK